MGFHTAKAGYSLWYISIALLVLLQFSVSVVEGGNCDNSGESRESRESRERDCDDDDDDSGLGKGAMAGLAIGAIALLVAVPTLLCFCCGCLCFKSKQPKIIGVTPSATLRKKQADISKYNLEGSPTPNMGDSGHYDPNEFKNSPTAPDFSSYPMEDNNGAFYYNLGYEPPPPYPVQFQEESSNNPPNHSHQAWEASAPHGEVNIDERIEKSTLGPSLIKDRIS